MTLFNFRLGAWLPNPGAPDLDKDVAMQSGPTYNIPTLLNELAGKASDSAPYVYLSDGGHFENLGLYEMLRRRCQHILAVDAGDDEKYTYESLAGALRAAFIDFGVTVKFTPEIVSGKPPANGIYFGKISYPAYVVGGKRFAPPAGQLIYLRTFLPDDPPVEISGYMQTHDHFPHETGTNQFFTESDFEAYRHLGACIAGRLISNARAAAKISAGERLTISNFFAAALTFCTKPPVQDIT
jgi:hypothetical protein